MSTLLFILSIFAGLLLLTFLVVIHELGHAIVARRNGVEVEEFGIGFPPKAAAWKPKKSFLGKDVAYSLNYLPIGGFVKLKGEHDSDRRKGTFGAATFWQKTKIMLAGVAINWLFAAILFTVIAVLGMPKLLPNQYTVESDTTSTSQPLSLASVLPDSPASAAGLKAGDEIVKVDDDSGLASNQAFFDTLDEKEGEQITITYNRDGTEEQVAIQLREGEDAEENGKLGAAISPDRETRYSTWSAPIVGVGLTAQLSVETVKVVGVTLGNTFAGFAGQLSLQEEGREKADEQLSDAQENVAGPVGIIGTILPNTVTAGLIPFLLITAIISLTLAVMNVLPIPALDGGRFYTMALFRILKKPLTKDLEETINATGFLIIIGLIILVTISDVGKFF